MTVHPCANGCQLAQVTARAEVAEKHRDDLVGISQHIRTSAREWRRRTKAAEARAEAAERKLKCTQEDFTALQQVLVGKTGLSAIHVAEQLTARIAKLEARLASVPDREAVADTIFGASPPKVTKKNAVKIADAVLALIAATQETEK